MKPWEKYASASEKPWERYSAPRASRGERNNNPGNIEDRGQFEGFPGYLGSDGRFAKFDSLETGRKAFHAQLQRYMEGATTGEPLVTVKDIIGTWSPASDPTNQEGSTDNYMAVVAKELGVSPDAKLELSDIPRLASAMGRVETGNKSFGTKPWENYQGEDNGD